MEAAQKVLAREALATLRGSDRSRALRLVLCNGVFDLLHVGHVRVLQAARARGDALVVALNDDASARHLKGPGRPLHRAAERAEVLAALACVDWVTTFPEPTVAETLRVLRPAVHAKGEDYRLEDIPEEERSVARELGIEIVFVGGPKERSSTELWSRLSARTAS